MQKAGAKYAKAQRLLARRDLIMKRLIKQAGACTLTPFSDGFVVLVRSIISQQISTKAANSIATRLENILKPKKIKPKNILSLDDEQLREAGLSTAKRRSLCDLSEKVQGREVRLQDLPDMSDEEVIEHLLPVRGIGRWTAEMYLIFALGRLDVLPVADLGLRVGVQREYELTDHPDKEQLETIAQPWRPYRTIATWYIWRTFGLPPQSE